MVEVGAVDAAEKATAVPPEVEEDGRGGVGEEEVEMEAEVEEITPAYKVKGSVYMLVVLCNCGCGDEKHLLCCTRNMYVRICLFNSSGAGEFVLFAQPF